MAKVISVGDVQSRLRTSFLGRRLVYRWSVASTMDVARAEAEAGAPEGTTVVADEQTAGRGRLGRAWVSPAGANLYLSVVFRPPAAGLRQLGIICPLAVCLAIEEVTGLRPAVKWPNDVLLGGRKAGGILVDVDLLGEEVHSAVAGIGLNVNFDPSGYPEIGDVATSLMAELGREVSREAVLAAILNHLEDLYRAALRGEAVHLAWKERLDTLGQRVRVRTPAGVEEGTAIDTDADGALLLRRDDGSTLRIEAGEVTLRADQASSSACC